ncbi:MAG: S8 family serine peptidase [Candidatus Sericytochromatia bacterium]
MKKLTPFLALLLLPACAAPNTAPVAATGAPAAAPEAPAPMRAFNVGAPAGEEAIIVRMKEGHEQQVRETWFGKTLTRQLLLARTHVMTVDASEREATLARLRQDPAVEYAEPDIRMYAFGSPSDPSYNQQWALPKMQIPQAWDTSEGGPVVAVVDTGVDYNHPDLQGQIVKGRDFANNDNDPMDDLGHGTHVAGSIAAATNNGTGIAGVAPKSKVLAVKVLGAQGGGDASDIAEGIVYAADQGAKIINLSLGAPQDSYTVKQAVEHAQSKGALVVSAAGNDGKTTKNYPAAYPGVIAVGSTAEDDSRSHFSQYGSWLTVAAPGSQIYSTMPNGEYKSMDGTSMASPHVAAVAALVLAKQPDWTAEQVREAVINSGDPVDGFQADIRRVDASKALAAAGGTAPVVSEPVETEPVVAEPSEPVAQEPVVQEPIAQRPAPRRGEGRPMPRNPWFPERQMPRYPY